MHKAGDFLELLAGTCIPATKVPESFVKCLSKSYTVLAVWCLKSVIIACGLQISDTWS
jgi:hypothetical protein